MRTTTMAAATVFVALLGVYWFQQTHQPQRGVVRVSLADVKVADIDRIEVVGPKPIALVRRDGRWFLGSGREADQDVVARLLDASKGIASTDLVSRSPSRYVELEVDEEQGVGVALYQGEQKVGQFVLGKAGRGGSFVRFDDAVYLVKRVYAATFARKPSLWANRSLFRFEGNQVTRLEVRPNGAESYVLIRSNDAGTWQFEDATVMGEGFRFDSEAADRFANTFATLRVKAFVDEELDDETIALDEGSHRFMIHTADEVHELRLGGKADGRTLYGRLMERENVWMISSHMVKRLLKRPESFRDLRLFNFEPSEVSFFEIVEGGRKLVLSKGEGEAAWFVSDSTESVPDGYVLDAKRIDEYLKGLAEVRGMTPKVYRRRRSAPRAQVTVVLDDGDSRKLRVWGHGLEHQDESVYVGRSEIDRFEYMLVAGTYEMLTVGLPAFGKQSLAELSDLGKLDAETLSKLPPEVREELARRQAAQGRAP